MALIAALAAGTAAAGQSAPPVERNVVYGMYSGLALLMDVRRPARPNGFAVLHIPGSGWQAPTTLDAVSLKDGTPPALADALLDAGFTVFTINHRAAPRFRFPAAVEDAQRAARFIRAQAARFGVRADRLAAVGASSGANLVAMLATTGEGREGAAPAAAPPRPDCVAGAMTPTDLRALSTDGIGVGYTVSYLGHPPAYAYDDEATRRSFDGDYDAASPIKHVSAQTSAMLLLHGDKDPLVPIDQAERFVAALRAAGGRGELVVMRGVGHVFAAPYTATAASWLARCMAAAK